MTTGYTVRMGTASAPPAELPKEEEKEETALTSAPALTPVHAAPRTFAEIHTARAGVPVNEEPVAQGGIVLKPWMLAAIASGIAMVIVIVVILATYQAPTTPVAQSGSTSPDGTPAPQATVNQADPRIPLRDRYAAPIAAAAQPSTPVVDTSGNDVVTADATFSVGTDGTMAISIPADLSCIPAWSSPPPSWSAGEEKASFLAERNGCVRKDANGGSLVIAGYWGDTNWMYFMRPKTPGVDVNQPGNADLVWSDITWFDHTRDEVMALPDAKSGIIKDYKPVPQPTAAPTQAPVYIPQEPQPTDVPVPTQTNVPVPNPKPKPSPQGAGSKLVDRPAPGDIQEHTKSVK